MIVTTNKPLLKMMDEGKFSRDLYYHLLTHHLHILPLRERSEDIPLLTDYFFTKAVEELKKKKPTVPEELYLLLSNYAFPGNIRELQSMIYHAVSQHQSRILSLTYFKDYIEKNRNKNGFNLQLNPGVQKSITINGGFLTLDELKTIYINEVLKKTNNNYSQAGEILGRHPSSLIRGRGKKK